ncbi:MAG: hypothetical protein GC200_03085 [Tepidisphaera sp.]|nr:hypothetical protein [Tepidisphaera sp.]
MKSVRMNLARIFLAAAVAGVASPLALAQPQAPAPTTVNPPTPSKPDDPPAILSLLATVVIIGAVCAPALLNPKRGHQD